MFDDDQNFIILSLLLYCLLCNVGLRHQNLSQDTQWENGNKNIYIQQKININKTSNIVKI